MATTHLRLDSRPPTRPPKGGHQKRELPAIEPAHRGMKGRQADGTGRVRTRRNLRLGAPRPLRGRRGCTVYGDTASLGTRTRDIPHGTHARRTNRDTPRKRVELPPSDDPESHALFAAVRWPVRPRVRMGNPRRERRGGCYCPPPRDQAGDAEELEGDIDCSLRAAARSGTGTVIR